MKFLRKLIRIELVLIYLVIVAGSVVRMTGSGMGCPDWPKCFGHIIPPTERSELEWKPNSPYQEGQIIIVDESLRIAKKDLITASSFNSANWELYTKHDYAHFDPTHTWIEYINRLFGALSGVPMLLIFFISLYQSYRTNNWILAVLGTAGLFMLGFEAWLGKLVVDGNLIPGSITIHMLGALVIVAILIMLLLSSRKKKQKYIQAVSPVFKYLALIALICSIFQIALGTQVREQIDYLNDAGIARVDWIDKLDMKFYIHRSFSLLILFVNLWLFWLNRKLLLKYRIMNTILLLIILIVLAGISLNYLDMMALAQPLHLVLAMLLFGAQFYLVGKCFKPAAGR